MTNHFDYQEQWNYVEAKGKKIFGPKFKLYQEDEEVILKMIIWFCRDEKGAEQFNIDLSKGIFLNGPVGCGKSSLMTLFKMLMRFPNKHYIFSCRDIAFEYANYGHYVFQKYTKSAFYRPEIFQGPVAMCFDDLGAEPEVQYFGSPCNPMAEILFSRYDYFISHKMITHITTNLNRTVLEHKYGDRVKSRLREMMNIVSFDKNSKDKRC